MIFPEGDFSRGRLIQKEIFKGWNNDFSRQRLFKVSSSDFVNVGYLSCLFNSRVQN